MSENIIISNTLENIQEAIDFYQTLNSKDRDRFMDLEKEYFDPFLYFEISYVKSVTNKIYIKGELYSQMKKTLKRIDILNDLIGE